jgi:hypothetical protein
VSKRTEGIPATIPAVLSDVFANSEFAIFKVRATSFDQQIQPIEDRRAGSRN